MTFLFICKRKLLGVASKTSNISDPLLSVVRDRENVGRGPFMFKEAGRVSDEPDFVFDTQWLNQHFDTEMWLTRIKL